MKNACKTKEGSGILEVLGGIKLSQEDPFCEVGVKASFGPNIFSEQKPDLSRNPHISNRIHARKERSHV